MLEAELLPTARHPRPSKHRLSGASSSAGRCSNTDIHGWKMTNINFILVTAATLCLTLGPPPTECARILAVLPFHARSHMVTFSSLTKELSRRGHEMVVISSNPLAKPMANYTDVDTTEGMAPMKAHMDTVKLFEMEDLKFYEMPLMMWGMGLMATELTLNTPVVKSLLNDKRGFDLVIVEAFMNEAAYGFADHFKAPLVLFSPFGGWHWLNYHHGNPALLSYVPNGILSYSDHMNFCERTINLLYTMMWDVGNELYYKPKQEEIRKKIFGNGKSVWDLEASTSITLLNNHFTLNYPRPLVPAIIEVGGMHVQRSPNKLPEDIQKFLDGATSGAIYFSMGSNLRSDQMSPERRQAFIDAFSALPQRVLWKWESDSLPGQPSNVKLGKWLPQQDILAHPNVQLFITHGGLLSLQEAAFFGVPLVGIPVFGDQPLNMKKADQNGFGVMLALKNVTKESILWAINKASQPSIRLEARRRSTVYRDQPEAPLERAVFWTEYVLRHKGAPHLRSASTSLSWYQVYLVDVLAAIFTVLLAFAFVVKKLLCMCCTSKHKPAEKDKKKKKQ